MSDGDLTAQTSFPRVTASVNILVMWWCVSLVCPQRALAQRK